MVRGANQAGAALVNTNHILQVILQQIQAEKKNRIILRCEELPFFPGTSDDLENVIRPLIQMILQKMDEVSQLFLHISCANEEDQKANRVFGYHSVQFHSNIIPSAEWLRQHEGQLNEVAAILQKYNGGLMVNQEKQGGCIFSISLPGKMM